jgi:hypothetical protein
MRRDDLNEYLDRKPFRPFRLYLSTGAFVDIRQPQLVHFSHSVLTLGQAVEGDQQRFLVIALIHIVWLELLVPLP